MRRTLRFFHSRYSSLDFKIADIAVLSYLLLIGGLLVPFHRNVPAWPFYALTHILLVFFILEIIRAAKRMDTYPFLRLLRIVYPLILMIFLWGELDRILLMFSESLWATTYITQGDLLLFGTHPTVWIQRFHNPFLSEIMNFVYTAYYAYFFVVPLTVFLAKKEREAQAIVSGITLLYLCNYIIFFIFPAAGPNAVPEIQRMGSSPPEGYLFYRLLNLIQDRGAVSGAAFPSSHVAGALVWAAFVFRYFKKLGAIMIPISLGVAVASVYLGLHHALDTISGIIVAASVYFFALIWMKKRGEDPAGF